MREIKFRAWIEDYREMAYSGQHNYLSHFFSYLEECYLETQYVIQQFTGLYDKNGKEIYEGDIYKTDGGVIRIVFFFGGAFTGGKSHENSVPLGWDFDRMRNDLVFDDGRGWFEVIGNIYVNPELLNEMK